MTILWADGFDAYGDDVENLLAGVWASIGTTTDLSTAQVRTGTHSLLIVGTGADSARRVFGGAKSRVGIGSGWYFPTLPTVNHTWRLYGFHDSNNQPQVTVFLDSTGQISAYLGDGHTPDDTLLGVSDKLVPARAWNHIEAWASFDTSGGSVEVRLNGVTVLNVAGVNTVNSTAPALGEESSSQVMLGPIANSTGTNAYVDDLIAADDQGAANNDFIGDKKVFEDFPDADTADVDWTPSSGSQRFAMVDEADPDGDGTYDEADHNGDVMGLTFPDLPSSITLISAILMNNLARKTDAGTCNVQVSVDSVASSADGEDRPMTTEYTRYSDAFEVDPDTGAPWTLGAANALSVRITRTA